MMLYSKFVQSIHLFRDLKLSQVNALCASLQAQDFDDGDTAIQAGRRQRDAFIVESGEGGVFKDGVVVSIVHEGDYFGELALVRNEPRQATVRAKGSFRCSRSDRAFKRGLGSCSSTELVAMTCVRTVHNLTATSLAVAASPRHRADPSRS